MNIQRILQIHKVSFSILVFIILLSFLHFVIQPAIIYNTDGSFKQFGIGYRNKTVTPIWLICIILGIFSYLFVCWMARVGL
jgi:hypothetical protein